MPADMTALFRRLRGAITLSYGHKLFMLATVPLLLAVTVISIVVTYQSRDLAEREIAALEAQLITTKRDELKNYLSIARTAFVNTYGRAAPDDAAAKLEVTQVLSSILYGPDGYFFVFDYEGNNLVAPRQTYLINRNWSGLEDASGIPITDELIQIARAGGGYHSFDWPKPSTGELGRMVVYVNGLQDWKWVIGTGIFIDDVLDTVTKARAEVENRISQTSLYIVAIVIVALISVFLSGLVLNIRERRMADLKLKALTQRIIDTQEEERGRVARELHDGISQMLVGVRYALELTKRRFQIKDDRVGDSLDKGIAGLGSAIQEVRRISRDLRPGVLDDLGLGPALQSLADEFGQRTGVDVTVETVVFRGRLDQEARISLYRIAQEALTNIERHSDAQTVTIMLKGNRAGGRLKITDNGKGMSEDSMQKPGLGLRNMQERIEQLGGTITITSTRDGTTIDAQVPLTHMLSPHAIDDPDNQRTST